MKGALPASAGGRPSRVVLVTAISAFYFGSSSLSSASRAVKGSKDQNRLTILRPGTPAGGLALAGSACLLDAPIFSLSSAIRSGQAV